MRKVIVLRKIVVITVTFAAGYSLGHYHALSEPNEVRFRRMRKETMARAEEQRIEKLKKQYRPK